MQLHGHLSDNFEMLYNMKHPSKKEPVALGKLVLEDSLRLYNYPDKKSKLYKFYIEKRFVPKNKPSISGPIIGITISSVTLKVYWISILRKCIILVNLYLFYSF